MESNNNNLPQQPTSMDQQVKQQNVQYTPEVNNLGYAPNFQNQGLDQNLGDDTMLELQDVNHHPLPQQQPQYYPQQIFVPPQQIVYNHGMPTVNYEGQQYPQMMMNRVLDRPTTNNYVNGMMPSMMINNSPNFVDHDSNDQTSSKYQTWTKVVLAFAIILVIYSVLSIVGDIYSILGPSILPSESQYQGISIPIMIFDCAFDLIALIAGSIGIWSTVTKNAKHRRYATIAHLALLSILLIGTVCTNGISGITVFQSMTSPNSQQGPYQLDGRIVFALVAVSIIISSLMIVACCGSCIGCQAYRFKLMKRMSLSENSFNDSPQEGFAQMHDEV